MRPFSAIEAGACCFCGVFVDIRNIIAGNRANQVAIPPAGISVLAILVTVFAEIAGTCAGASRSEELISSTVHFCTMGGFLRRHEWLGWVS